ncbi:hypothetical protein HDU67_001691, partial [Dinochytrium kinnereticum]
MTLPDLPITLLRKATTTSTPLNPLTQTGDPAESLLETYTIDLSTHRVPVTTPSGYKEYHLLTLLFFLENRNLEQAAYLQRSLAYWGKSGRDVPSDLEEVRRIQENERTLTNFRNFLSVKNSKGFSLALKHASEFLRPPKSSSSSSKPPSTHPSSKAPVPAPSASKPPSSSSVPQRPPRAGEKPLTNASSRMDASRSKGVVKPSSGGKIPIIMVPAASQSNLTLYNVKSFLVDYKYVPTEEFLSKGEPKPPMVVLERKASALPVQGPKTFHVYDSIDKLKSEDWERIVAVFATGQEWQFKNWKFGAPVNIFSKVLGFSLKFQDEPLNAKVKAWNVT